MNTDISGSLPDDYPQLLEQLKHTVRSARHRSHRVVNTELLRMYWEIGSAILARQRDQGWGAKVIERLAVDLRHEFPDMTGLSRSNLEYMRRFADAYPDQFPQRAAGEIPWGHIMTLLDKIKDEAVREWYAAASLKHGWSRAVLLNQIMNRTHERVGAAPSNFDTALPADESELAQGLAKDPYVFDFLGLTERVGERRLEQALVDRVQQTLQELGHGFAFVGRQVVLDVGGDEFAIDLLFFHVEQLRYVVVELKVDRFRPEYVGKLNFYVAAIDAQRRLPAHAPTVGLLLCAGRNDVVVRYSLAGTTAPMAVAGYTYDALPEAEQRALPSDRRVAEALTGEWHGTGTPREENNP